MQFNSYEFIVLFMPLLFAGYFLLNRFNYTLGKVFLIGMGAYFYIYYSAASALVLLLSLGLNYAAAELIARDARRSKLVTVLDVAANIALLLYFKYTNFLLGSLGSELRLDIFLPLGISFYTFQQISYVLSVGRKGRNENIIDYLLYIMFFPKLIMGPLAEPDELIPQFNEPGRKGIDWDNLACGLKLFAIGLFKKLIIADTFAAAVAWCFEDVAAATSLDLFLVMLAYTFEIYFDFSGYSDMAVGVARMLNIDLPINFDSPYKALSIRDFWKRWHMSLTGFFTRNVYIPLGGSRRGRLRLYLNVMLVFLLSGIWHGANWTFILWGLLHGALSVFERVFEKYEKRINSVIRWVYAFLSVNFLWLLFRAESVSQWLGMVKNMLFFENMAVSEELLQCFELQEAALLLPALPSINGLMALLFYLGAFLLCLVPENAYRQKDRLSRGSVLLAVLAFFFGFIHLGGESVFVYFNF